MYYSLDNFIHEKNIHFSMKVLTILSQTKIINKRIATSL